MFKQVKKTVVILLLVCFLVSLTAATVTALPWSDNVAKKVQHDYMKEEKKEAKEEKKESKGEMLPARGPNELGGLSWDVNTKDIDSPVK